MSESKLKKYKEGFKAGMKQIKSGEYSQAINDLKKALNINNKTSFFDYRTGKTEMKISQIEAVEAVFAKYGVTENIWGR